MKTLSFDEFVLSMNELPYDTGIYVNVGEWNRSPLEATLYLAEGEEWAALEESGRQLERLDLKALLQLPLFQDVVEVERDARPHAGLDDLVEAINHYRQFDAFRP
jgi:hypothetical protein